MRNRAFWRHFWRPIGQPCAAALALVLALVPAPAAAQADAQLRLMALGADAALDPEAALTEIRALLADPALAADPRAAFDLNRLAAEILETQGKAAEAAAVYDDLARFAARHRDRLGHDPVPLWRRAARLHQAAGDPGAARRAEEAVLADQRDGAMPAAVLADTLTRLEALAQAMGDPAGVQAYAAGRMAALAPPVPVAGVRGDGTGFATVEVFYATDRARSGSDYPAEFYGHGRGPLETGVVEVTVPDSHRPGAIEAPSVWSLEFAQDPARHITLHSITPLAGADFFARMQDRMAARDRKEAFVFIHGYNVAFDAAARRAAQLAYDMRFAGVPILYSWPSRGSTIGYIPDAAVVQLSARRLSRFLDQVVAQSGAETVHIVAHSMGNRALTEALELMALRRGQTAADAPAFGQVIFAAPDVDAGLFAEMLPTLRPLARRLTLYASENDWALVASRRLHGDAPRAGQGGADLLAAPDLDSVDMSELGEDMLAHGYFADDRSALADLVALFWRDLDPARRCGLQPVQAPATAPLWRYVAADCPDEALLAVMGSLQAEEIGTAQAAEAELARLVSDQALQAALAPVVLRMMAP